MNEVSKTQKKNKFFLTRNFHLNTFRAGQYTGEYSVTKNFFNIYQKYLNLYFIRLIVKPVVVGGRIWRYLPTVSLFAKSKNPCLFYSYAITNLPSIK